MTVYADVLVILNFLVDYFLIAAAGLILRKKLRMIRHILAALMGGFSSLYIFLSLNNVTFELAYKIGICALITLIGFGFGGCKRYFKAFLIVLTVTLGFGGIMTAACNLFKPKGIFVYNSVVYFDISPLVLTLTTVIGYLIFVLLSKIFSKNLTTAQSCEVTLYYDKNSTTFKALVDTGNSLSDVFGRSEVIIADSSVHYALFGDRNKENDDNLKRRYSPIPCATVGGNGLLDGYRCDMAIVEKEKEKLNLKSPIIALSQSKIDQDYGGIVNPEIFN